jgi:hypothetical protein
MKQAKLSFAGRASNPTKASPAQLAARKRFAEMARSGAFKKKATKRNPAKKTVSQKISQLRHEGYPQRQAVAVALSEQRAGKVKRNPMGEIQAYAITRNFKVLGIFQTKADAIKAAQGISDATGKTLAIKPVQVMAGHFNK